LKIQTVRGLILFLATGAYTGYAPFASGTCGSLVAIPLIFLSASLLSFSFVLHLGAVLASIAGACWIAGQAESYLDEHDSGKIVIDEIAGFLCATAFLDITLPRLVVAFFLFRLFDIVKPPPARYFDTQVAGGIGVVFDDVFAGVYANLVLRILLYMRFVS
jgi:phosphatidylglycerophosphatase A